MSFETFLALRYLKGSRRTLGGGLTTAIAVGGIAVGVAALITTLAVMTGFREDIQSKILGAQPHVIVMATQGGLPDRDWSPIFRDVPNLVSWSPFVMGQALIRKGSVTQGIVVKGVDPNREPSVTGLSDRLKEGEWARLSEPSNGRPAVFLGKELAGALHVSTGDDVLVAVPTGGLGTFMDAPPLVSFVVGGILETGLYDYDSSLSVMSMSSAQALFQMPGEFSGLGVRLKDADDSISAAMILQKAVGSSAIVRSWLALNKNLFAALRLEKVVMFLILTLITLVAAFTIVSNLLLVTAHRVREIGILRAMGATRASIEKIFLMKGLMMGGLGIFIGVGLGLILSWILKHYQFLKLPADVYYVENLPVRIVPLDIAMVAGAALIIVMAASYYPSRMAARLDALDAIRQ